MRSFEHRAVGDGGTGGALVNLGGVSADQRFVLPFGDVVALSGDYFSPVTTLFGLAAVPGGSGAHAGTRDELVCALRVMSADEMVVDRRFEPGGEFAGYRFSPRADRSDVERRVRDRYLCLAASNDDHFVSPGHSDARTGSGAPSALAAYRALHQRALDEAWRLGRDGGDLSRAMARGAAAQHYLTDAFAAGHLRTPVADIRRYWLARYPQFWDRLQRKVAADTAHALGEVSRLLRLVPRRTLHERTLAELTSRTSGYPRLSLGDLVARAFHDWDNSHGLRVEGGMVFGDGQVGEGLTMGMATAAVRAGVDDVEVAFGLGVAGRTGPDRRLYNEVRLATGAQGDAFRPEERVPRELGANPAQNWWANDVDSLWAAPMVGASGPTVGDAITEMLRSDGEFIRQLEGLGEGLTGAHGLLAAPVVGPWLLGRCCQAYHQGFVEPLARDPEAAVRALVAGSPTPAGAAPGVAAPVDRTSAASCALDAGR